MHADPEPPPALMELSQAAVPDRDDPTQVLIADVDWRVGSGEFWAVAGAPGSGKSQLLETAAGLLPPATGVHRLFGRVPGALPDSERLGLRLRVGLVFADGGRLFGHLTVAQNVSLPLCYHRGCTAAEVADTVTGILDQVGLTAVGDRLPGRLSRALRQRTALARALALAPELLFLDNPLSGLDAVQVRWWLGFLGALADGRAGAGQTPVTIVVATDDLRPWHAVARQFGLIRAGRWVAIGGRAELRSHEESLAQEGLDEDGSPGGHAGQP